MHETLYKVVEDIKEQKYRKSENDEKSLAELGYTVKYAPEKDAQSDTYNFTVTNTRNCDTTTVVLTKTWDDKGNQDGKRMQPADYVGKVCLKAGDQTLIPVRVDQTNTFKLYYVYDAANPDNNQPVKVHGSDQATLKIVYNKKYDKTPRADDTYVLTCANLPKWESQGTEIQYVMYEETTGGDKQFDDNYKRTDNNSDTFVTADANNIHSYGATNTHVPEKITVKVAKTWPMTRQPMIINTRSNTCRRIPMPARRFPIP